MPSGQIHDFGKKAVQTLSLLGLGFGLAACGMAKKSDSCKLKGDGLKLDTYSGETLADKELSLVFLKGPSEVTAKIGAYLEDHEISATFFIQGNEVGHHEAVLEKLAEEGHKIGTGGFSFTSLNTAQDPVLELRAADAFVTPFAYGNQYWYYSDHGGLSNNTLDQINRAGLGKYVGPIHADTNEEFFTIDEKCWENNFTIDACAQSYFNEIIRIGHGIIPFHDTDDRTHLLVEALVPQLTSLGYTFVRLDQISALRFALTEVGGVPDAEKGAVTCNDYE